MKTKTFPHVAPLARCTWRSSASPAALARHKESSRFVLLAFLHTDARAGMVIAFFTLLIKDKMALLKKSPPTLQGRSYNFSLNSHFTLLLFK